MPDSQPITVRPRVELRKYPNRRYYDSQRSCHVTLEEIHGMIRSGAEIRVTDSKTGDDITAKVLGQIILEHDPPKFGILPVELLHQLIRANEPLIREFVDKYFSQAFLMFVESQRQFDRYLRQTLGLDRSSADWTNMGADWTNMMMAPLRSMLLSRQTPPGPDQNGAHQNGARQNGARQHNPQDADGEPAAALPPTAGPPPADLQAQLDGLRQQIVFLQHQLDQRESRGN